MSGLTFVLLAALVPFFVGSAIATTCRAKNRSNGDRCRNIRPGPFHRCHEPSHKSQIAVPADFVVLGLWAVAAVVFYFGWLTQGGLPVLVDDLRGFDLGRFFEQGMPA